MPVADLGGHAHAGGGRRAGDPVDARRGQLAAIGLLSFAAIAQLAPAFFGGLFWRHATARGAMGGMIVGFAVWAYTLFVPSFLDGTAAPTLPPGIISTSRPLPSPPARRSGSQRFFPTRSTGRRAE